MVEKSSFVYLYLILGFCFIVCDSQTDADCNAADGVGSWMGDGTCDPQNLTSECNWDGGDCCSGTCDDEDDNDYACGTDGYLCLDPTQLEDESCGEEPPPPCSAEDQYLVVENTTDVQALAATMVNCSSGTFHVEWRGNIVVDTEIVVSYGIFLNVTGVGSSAVVDGGGETRLFRVVNACLHLNGVEIKNGNATFGGAIAAVNSSLSLHRASFIGNTATDKNGGAVFVYRSSISFSEQTDFFDNSANYGGALYAVSNSSILWEGVSNFTGNSATHSGGALGVVHGSTVSWIAKTTFEGNTATAYRGGALFIESGSSATWNEANFKANGALYEGGAIFVDLGSNASWSGGTMFSKNSVTFAGGGAILIGDSSTVELWGETTFEFNSCNSEGGAVSSRVPDSSTSLYSGNQESFLLITGATVFSNNNCGSNGGGVALLGGLSASFESSNITFVGNEAGVSGGGVFLSKTGVVVNFSSTVFDSNSAKVGGGVYIAGSGTSLDVEEFSAMFDKCSFIGNTAATTGGAMEIATGVVGITNTMFKSNEAEAGGALRVTGATSLENCIFDENLAGMNGAPALSMIGSDFKITSCSFSGNTYTCDAGTFINESESGDRFDFICSGCGNCTSCTIENRWKVPNSCSAVLEHSSSPGGHFVTLETLSIDPGYWRATNESTTILKCYNEDACAGGLTDSAGFCDDGYTGPYCAVCVQNYVKGPGYTCIKCSGSIWGIVAAAFIAVIAMVVTFTVFTFLTSTENVGRGRKAIARLLRRVPLHSIKIIIVAWQIVTQFSTATGLTFPGLYQRFLNAVSVFNFDVSWLLSAACMIEVDFHGRLLIVTVGPAVVMLFLSGTYTYVLQRHQASEETLRDLQNRHMSMILFVMFLVYSTSSSVVFQMFDCEVLDDGKNYLRADYTIECDEQRHRVLMIYTGFMILFYPMGIPAFFSYLLFRNRQVLMDKNSREEALSVRSISDLWRPYRPSRFYYEVIECGRRIVLTGVILTIDYDSAAQIAVTLILSFVFTVVSEGLAPYESQWDAWVSRLGHAVVFCTVYYALLLKVDVSDETHASQSNFEVLLVFTHIVMVVLVVFEATLAGCLFQKDEQVEDPSPRSNRHGPKNFRAASYSVPRAWLQILDSLATDEIETEVRTNSTSHYGHPGRWGSFEFR